MTDRVSIPDVPLSVSYYTNAEGKRVALVTEAPPKKGKPTGGASAREGARKSADFKAVSSAPSINKTPVGNSTPPLPYNTFQDLSNSQSEVPTVTLNGDPAYVLDQTTQSSCKGDDVGTANGIRSNTVNGEVKPTGASGTVTFGGKWVVRSNDPCVMNGGNNPGIYVTASPASANPAKSAADTSNPPPKLETPQEQSAFDRWWDKTKNEIGQAVEHPWEGIKGAAKGIANIPSEIAELIAKGSALDQAGQLEQSAALQSLFGQTQAAQNTLDAAQAMRQSAEQINVPKFEMSNPAQAGGDKISTVIQLAAGGAGIVKSAGKGLTTMAGAAKEAATTAEVAGEVGQAAKATEAGANAAKGAEAANAADTAKAEQGAAKAAESPGDGVVVKPKKLSLREKYLGRTPGKDSRTGKEVQERMRSDGQLREVEGKTEFLASDGKWYDLSKADMAHKTDAVTWWNETGSQYGAKAPEVREWMLDSKNYVLDHYSLNRSSGSILGQTTGYLPPLK